MVPSLAERFAGSMLGLAVGDALGAPFEGQSPDWIAARFPSPDALISNPPNDELWYTDDTQMAIGVAETLAEHGAIVEDELCRTLVSNYVPSRGYGRGTRLVLEAMEDGRDHRQVAASVFSGGSYGNGAAMRVAPVGLLFGDDLSLVWDQARLSALPTHLHPLGIEGAQVLALAVALCSRLKNFDPSAFFSDIIARAETTEFRQRLQRAASARCRGDLMQLGNGIEAFESVPTAIACFARFPDCYQDAIGTAILLGGDTDTIAAMTGAIAGAFLGVAAIPANLLDLLEDQTKGRTYIADLATRLYGVYHRR